MLNADQQNSPLTGTAVNQVEPRGGTLDPPRHGSSAQQQARKGNQIVSHQVLQVDFSVPSGTLLIPC
jgi:hypothetical protein